MLSATSDVCKISSHKLQNISQIRTISLHRLRFVVGLQQSELAMFDQTKKSSYVQNICKFMSLQNDTVVRTLSILEFDFCFHLEYHPNIKSFTSQPFGFHYKHFPI